MKETLWLVPSLLSYTMQRRDGIFEFGTYQNRAPDFPRIKIGEAATLEDAMDALGLEGGEQVFIGEK